MKITADVLDFTVCLLFYFIGAVAPLQISPNQDTVEKYANSTHVHSCYGDGVKWYNQKKQLVPAQGRVHVEDINEGITGSRLFFERLETADEGEYTCKMGGEMVTFKLKVIKSISFGMTPTLQRANELQNLVLKCDVSGLPKPTVTWEFRGRNIEEGNKYKIMPSGLEIKNVTVDDVGEYLCRAYQTSITNSDWKEVTITLRLRSKPVWANRPNHSDRDMFFGYLTGVVNLTCAANAEPEAKFTWKRHGKPLKPSHYNGTIINEPHRSILQLPIHNTSYYGEYECQAQNEYGKIDRIIVLEKGEKPNTPFVEVWNVTVHTAQVKALSSGKDEDIIGFRVTYTVKLPGLETNWTSYGFQDFNKTDEGVYTVTDLLENTEYNIKVASRNVAGLSDFSTVYSLRTTSVPAVGAAPLHLATLANLVIAMAVVFTH